MVIHVEERADDLVPVAVIDARFAGKHAENGVPVKKARPGRAPGAS